MPVQKRRLPLVQLKDSIGVIDRDIKAADDLEPDQAIGMVPSPPAQGFDIGHGRADVEKPLTTDFQRPQLGIVPFADSYPQLLQKFLFIKEATFGLAICGFLIFEPNGLAYRWWQIKNYFNLWPFSY